MDQRHGVGRLKRRAPSDQVVEHRAEGVDVGTAVHIEALDLLGRHVGQRADAVDLGRVGRKLSTEPKSVT